MKKYPLIALLCFLFPVMLSGQMTADSSFLKVESNLLTQIEAFPQEKLHLQTDRDMYVPGEKIWFKAYLADAATLQPSTNSRYIYVELISPNDSLIDMAMIRPENGMFYGNLFISGNIPEGDYTLRAYTRNMENLGDDYFFKKNIQIGSLDSGERQTNRAEEGKGIAGQARNDKQGQWVAGQARNDRLGQGIAGDAESSSGRNDIKFPEETLPGGILQFVLFDEQMNPLSERLVFSKNYDCATVEFQTDSETYKTREHVAASLSLTDSDGNPLAGNLSVAVTDDKDIGVDSTTTILSTLLLSSELKGYIENPAYYLQDNKEANTALDYLMLTHGWRRYNIPEVIKGNYETPQIPFQTSQEITGGVKSWFRSKPVADSEILIMAKERDKDKNEDFGLTATDETGAFKYKDFEYPDSTTYFVQALGNKGSRQVELVLDRVKFPLLIHAPQTPVAGIPVNKEESNAFLEKAEQRLKYDEGIRTIQLHEVEVTAKKIENKDEPRLEYWANSSSDVTVRRKDFVKQNLRLVSDILRGVAGVKVYSNGCITIVPAPPGKLLLPYVLIDGMPVDWPDPKDMATPYQSPLETVTVSDVESIDIFTSASSAALFGVYGTNGAISITTRRGIDVINEADSLRAGKILNRAVYTPLGYQKPAAFYSPKYETLESENSTAPDYRTTIFWKPDIIASDTGEAGFDFYTSDFPTTYSVVIEGLTNDGKIVRQVEKIRVE